MEPQEGTVATPETATEPAFVDPLAAELAEVRAALATEEGKTLEAEVKPIEQDAAPVTTAPAEAQAEPKAEDHKGNPTSAIIALRKRNQELATQNLLLQGQNQALTTMARPAQAEAEPEPAPVDPLQAVRDEKIALADKFDAGEISARDMEAQRQALDDREWEVRQARMQPLQQAPATDLQLELATAKLEADYPVLNILTADDLAPLATLAMRQAERDGKPVQPGALGTLDLRTRIAKLANQMYGGATPSTASTPQPALSEEAQARERKMAFAAGMPPDVTKMGSPASDTLTNESDALARMEGMTEEQQWALLKTLPVSARTTLGLRR